MGKLIGLTIAFVMINVFLMMWGFTITDTEDINVTTNPIVAFIEEPTKPSEAFKSLFTIEGLATVFGFLVAGIALTFGAITKNEILMFAGMAAVFMGYALLLLPAFTGIPKIISVLAVGPFMVLYFLSVIDWLRGKD